MGQVENKSENGRFKSNYINNSLNIGQQTPHQKKKQKQKTRHGRIHIVYPIYIK